MNYKAYICVICSNDTRVRMDNFYLNEDGRLNEYGKLKESFDALNIDFAGEIKFKKTDSEPGIYLFLDMPNFEDYKKINTSKFKVLLLREPETLNKKNYSKQLHNYFDLILTWKSDLVDNTKYFHITSTRFDIENSVGNFEVKKEICMIAKNPSFYRMNSMYAERKKFAKYLLNKIPNEFDLYGAGWDKRQINLRGRQFDVRLFDSIHSHGYVDNKLNTLSRYLYNVCFENTIIEKDYISEKIFDNFLASTIPIYLGAPNIEQLIDSKYYLDFRSMTYQDVVDIVTKKTSFDYDRISKNIKNFYLDKSIKKYTVQEWIKSIKINLLNHI